MRCAPAQSTISGVPDMSTTLPSTSRAPLLLVLLLSALCLTYANAIDNPFLVDDKDIIATHPDVIRDAGIASLWTHDYWAGRAPYRNLYRPVTILTYYLNARAPGVSESRSMGVIHEMDPAIILQPGPACLTDGLDALARIIRPVAAR